MNLLKDRKKHFSVENINIHVLYLAFAGSNPNDSANFTTDILQGKVIKSVIQKPFPSFSLKSVTGSGLCTTEQQNRNYSQTSNPLSPSFEEEQTKPPHPDGLVRSLIHSRSLRSLSTVLKDV